MAWEDYGSDAAGTIAYAILDGKTYDIGFNVLNPAELVDGIARLIADELL